MKNKQWPNQNHQMNSSAEAIRKIAIERIEFAAYRRGLVDAAELCRLMAEAPKRGFLERQSFNAAASALLELAQSLIEIPKP
jgi:hypothetical protein